MDYAEAVIGTTADDRVVYSYTLMAEYLMQHEGMSYEDAVEFIDYNTIRSLPYAGEKAPIVMYDLDE